MKNSRVYFFLLLAITFLLGSNTKLFAQANDTLIIYWLQPVEVTAKRLNIGDTEFFIEKDNYTNVLEKNGFSLIRKGVFFAQDVYADGLKRGDINVVIDGERYHSACPNRMDSPLTRINPMDIGVIKLTKTTGSLQSGLGGVVEFKRSSPGEEIIVNGGITGSVSASRSIDAVTTAEGYNHRISARYTKGNPYEDAKGRNFSELYGYIKNFDYQLAEVSFRGKQDLWKYGLSFSYTDNVSFPYLRMDERLNRVYSSFLSYKENKIYFNYTDHLMDNGLRESNMVMTTDARNFTLGVIGDIYEIYYRNWNADNKFISPMARIDNAMMPDVNMYSASLHKSFHLSSITLSGKIGLIHHSVGNENRVSFYNRLYPYAEGKRWFPIFGIGTSYTTALSPDWGIGVLAEAASEAPETESLFISVQKPMGKAYWSGNPDLKAPLRTTIRGSVSYKKLRLELFGSHIRNYVNLTKASVGQQAYLTYKNVDGNFMGFNIQGNWEYLDFNASYTWAENTTNDSPMAEIIPFSVTTTLKSPTVFGFSSYLKHTFTDAQTRVDESLNESSTPSWNLLSFGLNYSYQPFKFSLSIKNLTNELYHQHLSYLRDPFSSGMKVYEMGRTVRMSISFLY